MPSRDLLAPANPRLKAHSTPSQARESSAAPPSARPHLVTGIVVSMEGRIHREALGALLSTQPDFRVLGATDTCAETITLCAAHRPKVLVLGIHLAWQGDQSPLSAIRLASPTTGVLALAPHGTDRCSHLNPPVSAKFGKTGYLLMARSTCLQEACSRGALAALDGDADPASLFEALRSVARGERWGAGKHAPANGNGNGHSLSPQELKVARLIGQGASNKEIAASLAISSLTVKKHVGSILQKLGLNDRLQLGLSVARYPMAFGNEGARD